MADVINDLTGRLRSRPVNYRADIDGIRAIAVLAVVFFHAGLWFPGGFVGVDVFFVISGFLITTIVTRDVKAGMFTYFAFWERRARRLIPAMAVVVIASSVTGYFILLPHDFKELGQSVVAQTIAAATFYFWRESGYFAGTSEVKPLLHTWSLAVEEQFYLFMPGILVILTRRVPKYTIHALAITTIASLAWCVYSTPVHPDAAFYLLPARSWELSLGATIALTVDRVSLHRLIAETLSLVGMVVVVTSLFVYRVSTPFPGSYAIFPCIGTAAMIVGNSVHTTLVCRVLSWRPLVFVGVMIHAHRAWL